MFQTLSNAWKVPDVRRKLLFTVFIIVLYRIGANIPVPYVSPDVFESVGAVSAGTVLYYLNILSGDALGKATLFALGVSPYITSSIVMQLLTIAIPALERLSKEGAEGKKKITAITRVVTVALAIVTAIGYVVYLDSFNMLVGELNFLRSAIMVFCYAAGAALIMWLAEKINEDGMGNGISMILFANIVAGFPSMVYALWSTVFTKGTFSGFSVVGLILALCALLFVVAIMILIVWFTNSERRIPIQYAKRVVGRKTYGGQGTHLPLKLNMAGVMPIIFASSIVSIPATIGSFFPNNKFFQAVLNWFNYDKPLYVIIYFILIVLFAYFYIAISFNPVEVANNLKDNGGAVPGIRPGRPTAQFISKILNRITLMGALFLSIISCVPMIIFMIAMAISETAPFTALMGQFAFSGSSSIIVIGVALETMREIEAQITMRNYKGFLD